LRVYLPATLPLLRRWRDGGQAPAGRAHAVTPGLREWYRDADEEELEYVAQLAAGRAALALLAADPDAPRRRVILAADVAELDVAAAGERGEVSVGAATPVASWASVLVDDEEADVVVSAAVTALAAAAAGDPDASFALDSADAAELAWYAVQEIDRLDGA
jgi:hypothetical protein